MVQFRYDTPDGSVWALDPDATHYLRTSVGILLATYPGTHAGTLTEEAHTAPYCYPAGDGWQRHGECTDRNGFTLWVWRRLWTMLLPTDKGNGRRT